jgi:hypothetical protein
MTPLNANMLSDHALQVDGGGARPDTKRALRR